MTWVENFDLFLFDFDGLLVDTEPLHYRAYVEVLAQRGFLLDWSFERFCGLAHLSASALREAFYAKWPDLDPDWEKIYADKKNAYLELVQRGEIKLMKGVEKLLTLLKEKEMRRCVVTHSPQEQIDLICSRLPLLNTIPHWVTRHQYKDPKPHPECYQKAIELYAHKGDRIIGFEDSIRGWQALRQTEAKAILICSIEYPLIGEALALGAISFPSFDVFAQ